MTISAEKTQKKIWKVRIAKIYQGAHNHLLIGRVLEFNECFIRMDCNSYHFGSGVTGPKSIKTGRRMVRIVPWHRIEIVNELSPDFAFDIATMKSDDDNQVILTDNKMICRITSAYEQGY